MSIRAGASADRPPLLRVTDLEKHFPIRKGLFKSTDEFIRAVDGVSLQIGRGETLSLVGESGCGKSTFARAILRLVEPTGGKVFFDGVDVRSMGREELRLLRRRFQIVFQDPFGSLNPRMTADSMIDEVLKVHGLSGDAEGRRVRVAELLGLVGLHPEDGRRHPHEFSGGQRQRIAIARALAVEPELLICDEPVSSLDVSVQAQILNLLQDLQDELGIAYLFITHDLSVVRHMSDRVAVMYLGKIVEAGAVGSIFERPLHPYTKALFAAIPGARRGSFRSGSLAPEGDEQSVTTSMSGCSFFPRCPHPGKDRACQEEVNLLEFKEVDHSVACVKAEIDHSDKT